MAQLLKQQPEEIARLLAAQDADARGNEEMYQEEVRGKEVSLNQGALTIQVGLLYNDELFQITYQLHSCLPIHFIKY